MLGWLMRGSGSAMKLIGLTWQRNPDLSFWDFKRDVQHVRLWKLQSVAFFQATPKVGPNVRHNLNAMHLLSGAFSFLTCVMVVSWIHTAMCCRIKVVLFFSLHGFEKVLGSFRSRKIVCFLFFGCFFLFDVLLEITFQVNFGDWTVFSSFFVFVTLHLFVCFSFSSVRPDFDSRLGLFQRRACSRTSFKISYMPQWDILEVSGP